MGIIFLALLAAGEIDADAGIPLWVKFACALAIAMGTYIGGWRIIRTLGKGLVEIDSPQGMAAEGSSAAIILTSSHFGMALSTTHVVTGSIIGTGLGRKGAEVRWGVMLRMVVAWLITLPASGIVGALTFFIGDVLNRATRTNWVGELVVFLILIGFCGWMFMHSRKNPVSHDNVNDDWEESSDSAGMQKADSSETATLQSNNDVKS